MSFAVLLFAGFALTACDDGENTPVPMTDATVDAALPDAMLEPDGSDESPITIDRVESASLHYIRVFFDGARPDEALQAAAYMITDPAGVPLDTLRVLDAADGLNADLLVQTAPQIAGTTYTLQTATGGMDFVASADPGPALVNVEAISPTEVRLTFDTAPLRFRADRVRIIGADDAPLRVLDVRTDDPTQLRVTTSPHRANTWYRVDAFLGRLTDERFVPVDPTRNAADFTGLAAPNDGVSFRVVSAASMNHEQVRVHFSRSVAADTIQAERFVITQENVNAEAAAVSVLAAEIVDAAQTEVLLTTRPQNEVTYRLTIAGVTDVEGQPIGPRQAVGGVLVDPGTVLFAGTAAPADLDTDGDGLPDNIEQRGWQVVIARGGEVIEVREKTSDPLQADTDGDGLGDALERRLSSDPRTADTDFDQIADADEFNIWFSTVTDQDSDRDGVSDTAEINLFGTSPIDPDTDGDQLEDGDELFRLNRNPRRADLPQIGFEVGDIVVNLDAQTSFTSDAGGSSSQMRSVEATLSSTRENATELSDGRTTMTGIEASVGVEGGSDGFSVSAEVGVSASESRSVNFTQSSRSEVSSSTANAFSVESGVDFNESITRTVAGARMAVTLDIYNAGDIAFIVRDIELAALRFVPGDPLALQPVGVLSNEAEIELGTLGAAAEVGPIVFESGADGVFPAQAMALLLDPRAVLVELSRFNLTFRADPEGPELSFAETTESVDSRTAGVTIDFGDGRVETHQIATTRQFGADGRPMGISLAEAFEDVLDLRTDDVLRQAETGPVQAVAAGDDTQVVPVGEAADAGDIIIEAGADGVIDTPALMAVPGGSGFEVEVVEQVIRGQAVPVRRLSRILDLENVRAQNRFWATFTDADVDPQTDFDVTRLNAGDTWLIVYVRDQDEDGIFEREEFTNGTSDLRVNSDGCPGDDPETPEIEGGCPAGTVDALTDTFEIRVGWDVDVVGQPIRRVFPDPAEADSDDDGLLDHHELLCGLDPNTADTDDDGLSDGDEVLGLAPVPLDAVDEQVAQSCLVEPAFTDPLSRDSDGDGLNDRAEIEAGTDPTVVEVPDNRRTVTVRYETLNIDSDCDPEPFFGSFDPRMHGDGDLRLSLSAALEDAVTTLVTSDAALATANGLQDSSRGIQVPARTLLSLESETARTLSVRAERDQRITLLGTVVERDGANEDAAVRFGPGMGGPSPTVFAVGELPQGETQVEYLGVGICGSDGLSMVYHWTVTAVIVAEGAPGL